MQSGGGLIRSFDMSDFDDSGSRKSMVLDLRRSSVASFWQPSGGLTFRFDGGVIGINSRVATTWLPWFMFVVAVA